MEILKKDNIQQAIKYMQQGKTGIFPSETSYGLGCDATNQEAVDRIYDIKNRNKEKSLLVVVPTIQKAKEHLVWNDDIEKLANMYWPGPLTIVGKSKGNLAKGVISQKDTIAVRVTNHPILKQISSEIGTPIVATSANITYQGDVYVVDKIIEMYRDKEYTPDFLLDFGSLPKKDPTTIVSTVDGIRVLRQGEVKINI